MSLDTLLASTRSQTPTSARRGSVPATRFHAPPSSKLIFAGMQHLPAIRHKVSAFVGLSDARASSALTGVMDD